MVLTLENMATKPNSTGQAKALAEDIVLRMDAEQLNRYVRAAFTGQREDFLPAPFWEQAFSFRSADSLIPTPGTYFAKLYIMKPEAIRGTNTHYGAERGDYPMYRAKLEGILVYIFEECLYLEGKPSHTQLSLARSAVDAVGIILGLERTIIPRNEFEVILKERGVAARKIADFLDSLRESEQSKIQLTNLSAKLREDRRYASFIFRI